MRSGILAKAKAIWASAVSLAFLSCAAQSADMATKAPFVASPTTCAVDGINGSLGGLGGSFSNKTFAAAEGVITAPLGCSFGAQLDLRGGSFDGRFIGSVAGHLFWRNPSQGLLGAYANFDRWNKFGGVRDGHLGPEAEIYSGQWTLQGVAGVEFGNSASGTVGSVIQTFSVPTRFFDELNVAYYVQDDLQVYAGHRYLGGRNALALGGEWGLPLNHGVMAAPFAEARIGEAGFHGVWGGLRFYLSEKDKTLIRRHRENDPNDWDNAPASFFNGQTQTPVPPPQTGGGGGGGECPC